jgi:hypothetical protein
MLGLKSLEQILDLLQEHGSADAFSLNICFWTAADGDKPRLQNLEIGPRADGGKGSELSLHTIQPGTFLAHANT